MWDARRHKKGPLLSCMLLTLRFFRATVLQQMTWISCVIHWTGLYWAFPSMNTTLSSVWQMGTDPKDKASSCLWEFASICCQAWENKESSQGLIRACQGWSPVHRRWDWPLPPQGHLACSLLLSRGPGCSCSSHHSEAWLMWPLHVFILLRKWFHLILCCEFLQDLGHNDVMSIQCHPLGPLSVPQPCTCFEPLWKC